MNEKRVALVVGASRGIGRQVAIDLAKNGYAGDTALPNPYLRNRKLTTTAVIVSAKSTSDAQKLHPFPPDPNSPQSTISTVQREIVDAGGDATAIPVDTCDFARVQNLINKTIEAYGRLDVLVYNSGAIWWAPVKDTPMKRFQLMQRVNPEGLYGTVQAALPYLKKHGTGRIIVVSPPIYSRFFRGKTAYAMGKVAMSVLTKGLAMDFEREGLREMAITSVWPAVAIESGATLKMVEKNPDEARDLRRATIFSDAILVMLNSPASTVNGRLELDEDFLRSDAGVTDFDKYAVVPGSSPRRIMPAVLPSLSVKEQDDEGKQMNSAEGKSKL